MSSSLPNVSRRRFIKSMAALGAVVAAPAAIPAKALGLDGQVAPSERINLGTVGVHSRGWVDLGIFLERKDIQYVANCDIRKDQRERNQNLARQMYGDIKFPVYNDMNDLFLRDDVDAVLIATGDRWHTLASITASRYGKDVYCEKPLSLTIAESIALAVAVERSGIVYQAGTQRRNIGNFQLAAELVRKGKLGKLLEVHANTLWPATNHNWLPAQSLPAPSEIDWDKWLGPCPWRPYNFQYVDGNWRNFYDFHGGGILEWGSHTVDLCQWAAQKDDTAPVKYEPQFLPDGSKGGEVYAWYADGVKLVMRSTGWHGMGSCSSQYVGEEGWVETGDSGRMAVSSDALRKELKYFPSSGANWSPKNHIDEFCECVKSRRTPSANAKVAAQSHIVCHCAYIAWQLGRTLNYDPVKNEFINDEEANRMRSRAMREGYTL